MFKTAHFPYIFLPAFDHHRDDCSNRYQNTISFYGNSSKAIPFFNIPL